MNYSPSFAISAWVYALSTEIAKRYLQSQEEPDLPLKMKRGQAPEVSDEDLLASGPYQVHSADKLLA